MTDHEKVLELESQLREVRPGFAIAAPHFIVDTDRWAFRVEWNADLTRSKSFTVSERALDDLDTADIIAFVRDCTWWDHGENGGHVLHIGYDEARGLFLPEE